ncbi:MAG: hypothetical protein P4M01_13850 [Acidobacteriota bacterium]|nr:hypothetical protein [Acidobacteriota bacterium]
MSYSRSYSHTVTGVASTSRSYPASQSGGSMTVNIPYSQQVLINLLVDTDPFDASVDQLDDHLYGLAGSVVAAEAAQIAARQESATNIAQSVKRGFFTLIRSEISQQTVGLRSRIESLLLKLRDMREACLRIKQNMQADYSRITERYVKVFDELDRELQKRVASIDRSSMTVRSGMHPVVHGHSTRQLCTEATVTSSESGSAQSQMLAGAIRAQSQALLLAATAYMGQEQRLSKVIGEMLTGAGAGAKHGPMLPVLLVEMDSAGGTVANVYLPPKTPRAEAIVEQASGRDLMRDQHLNWGLMPDAARQRIERHIVGFMERLHDEDAPREQRLRQTVWTLWQNCTPRSLS